MGKPKQMLEFGGQPLIAIVVSRLKRIVDEIVVSIGGNDRADTYLSILPPGTMVVRDEVESHAPLVGFCSGLRPVRSDYTFIVSCDMPFLNPAVVEALFTKAEGGDAALPRWPDGLIEPLHAVYRTTRALEAACMCIKARRFKNLAILEYLSDVRFVDVEEFRDVDQEMRTFFNVNTVQDYERALEIFRQKIS